MVSLLAGKPNADTFPFESITLKLKAPSSETLSIDGDDLDEALQYGMTAGLPRLVQWLEAFQSEVQGRGKGSDEGWRVTIGVGSQDLISKVRLAFPPSSKAEQVQAFRALTDEDDSVLLETPVYSGVLGCLAPEQLNRVGALAAFSSILRSSPHTEVASDDTGMSADALEAVLSTWQRDRSEQRSPRVLYTCPTGSNPTGRSATEAKKRAMCA